MILSLFILLQSLLLFHPQNYASNDEELLSLIIDVIISQKWGLSMGVYGSRVLRKHPFQLNQFYKSMKSIEAIRTIFCCRCFQHQILLKTTDVKERHCWWSSMSVSRDRPVSLHQQKELPGSWWQLEERKSNSEGPTLSALLSDGQCTLQSCSSPCTPSTHPTSCPYINSHFTHCAECSEHFKCSALL